MTSLALAQLAQAYTHPHMQVEGFTIPVTIKDIRKVWNRVDFLVVPVQGTGEKWISHERIVERK